jgi:hypothetical protein
MLKSLLMSILIKVNWEPPLQAGQYTAGTVMMIVTDTMIYSVPF